MKDYSYRRKKLTIYEGDIIELHKQIDDFNSMIDRLPKISKDISNTVLQTMLAAAQTMKSLPKDQYELDLLLYLENIKPHCRSSSYLDE